MHFITRGQGDLPIVFVHGFACDSNDWRPVIERLQERNALVACDLPGHGASPGAVADCSIEAYGAAVCQLLANLDLPPAVLVGHSMGCRVVLESYSIAPDRVAGIVLLDGSFIGAGDRGTAELGMARQLADEGYEEFVRGFFAAMFVESTDPEFRTSTIERALLLPADTGASLFVDLAGWDASRMRDALAAVDCPLLVIQCTSLTPERLRVSLTAGQSSPWLELVREQAPTARFETLLDNGHFPHVEAPDEVSTLIADFVAGLTHSEA